MKKTLQGFSILIILFLGVDLSAQTDLEKVEMIQGYVEDIHLDTLLKSVSLENDEFMEQVTDGGGELTGFYRSGRIYKIYRSVGISYGMYITEYYYRKNELMFVHEKFSQYGTDTVGTFDYTIVTTTYSGNYFFEKGKMIYSNSTGHSRFEADSVDAAKTLTEESAHDSKLIEKKIKSVDPGFKLKPD